MSELAKRVNERMKDIEQQVRADYQAAWERLNEFERYRGDLRHLHQLVAEIELQREEKRLASLEKLLSVLAGATGEVQQALADVALKNFQRGEDSAYQKMAQKVDQLAFSMFGRSWVEDQITEVLEAQYGKERKRGNGKKE